MSPTTARDRTDVVLVDWLGRGGIAQTSAAWSVELRKGNIPHVIVTRRGRELSANSGTLSVPPGRSKIATHSALARGAAAVIRELRPRTVVVQNYVIPPLERPVYEAASAVGARTVMVAHDMTLPSRLSGTHIGLSCILRATD
ncbi:MAG: hypothetical protein M3144_04130, partial [Actinomycetota bacterium]|nr:hypothetical protein [Actinomycetota bacterium]